MTWASACNQGNYKDTATVVCRNIGVIQLGKFAILPAFIEDIQTHDTSTKITRRTNLEIIPYYKKRKRK